MHRGPALMISGALSVVAAVLVFVGALMLQFDGWVRLVGWILVAVAALTVARAVWLGARPPAVLKLDDDGFQFRASDGAVSSTWLAVEKVAVDGSELQIDSGDADAITIPMGVFDEDRRVQVLREVHDRLNAANGYERFTLE